MWTPPTVSSLGSFPLGQSVFQSQNPGYHLGKGGPQPSTCGTPPPCHGSRPSRVLVTPSLGMGRPDVHGEAGTWQQGLRAWGSDCPQLLPASFSTASFLPQLQRSLVLPPGFKRMLQYRLACFSPSPKPAWNFGLEAVSICPSASQMFLPLIFLFLYPSLFF